MFKLKEVIKNKNYESFIKLRNSFKDVDDDFLLRKGLVVDEPVYDFDLDKGNIYYNIVDCKNYICLGKGLITDGKSYIYYGNIMISQNEVIENCYTLNDSLDYKLAIYDKEYIYVEESPIDTNYPIELDKVCISMDADKYWIAQRLFTTNYYIPKVDSILFHDEITNPTKIYSIDKLLVSGWDFRDSFEDLDFKTKGYTDVLCLSMVDLRYIVLYDYITKINYIKSAICDISCVYSIYGYLIDSKSVDLFYEENKDMFNLEMELNVSKILRNFHDYIKDNIQFV